MNRLKVVAEIVTGWAVALRAARKTVGKENLCNEPTSKWKLGMLISEHSPIRCVQYYVSISNIRQWVTVHLVRHHIGIEKFVSTQREDRKVLDCSRDELPQGSLNDMDFIANPQALINMSRKRLCSCASPETRDAWKKVRLAIEAVDPEMSACMVKECIYRGFCPEKKTCGYTATPQFTTELNNYRCNSFLQNDKKAEK